MKCPRFGGQGVTATVTAWEPSRRVVFEGDGDRALAHEWLVGARDASSCVVRLVVSGVPALAGTVESVGVTDATHTYFLLVADRFPPPDVGPCVRPAGRRRARRAYGSLGSA